jgi:hypothetical protein
MDFGARRRTSVDRLAPGGEEADKEDRFKQTPVFLDGGAVDAQRVRDALAVRHLARLGGESGEDLGQDLGLAQLLQAADVPFQR